jgi:hypothetical protein
MGTMDSFPRGKAAERDADLLPQFSAAVKNMWSYNSLPQYAFMALCSVKKHGEDFTLILSLTLWTRLVKIEALFCLIFSNYS